MRIAVIGDIHGAFIPEDVEYFSSAGFDLILVVGDLPGRLHNTRPVAEAIAKVQAPVLLIPGNHDATTIMQVIAEIRANNKMITRTGRGMQARVSEFMASLGPVQVGGFSLHRYGSLQVLVGRPHTMGGPVPGFLPYLEEAFAVKSMDDSAQKIQALFDRSLPDLPVLVLAHNGPTGLGTTASDIFGCDFKAEEGDFGDADLEMALAYGRQKRNVLGVVAGHMHHKLKNGGERACFVFREGLFYLNAARVPRIFRRYGQKVRYHAEIKVTENSIRIEEVLISGRNKEERISLHG